MAIRNSNFIIPNWLSPLATQQKIVAEIEAEQALVAANRELIARFEKKSSPLSPASGGKRRVKRRRM